MGGTYRLILHLFIYLFNNYKITFSKLYLLSFSYYVCCFCPRSILKSNLAQGISMNYYFFKSAFSLPLMGMKEIFKQRITKNKELHRITEFYKQEENSKDLKKKKTGLSPFSRIFFFFFFSTWCLATNLTTFFLK